MVCEEGRARSLLVNRRGAFFEDPFFRDAWDDYSHAVRRIVDRFNHGWFENSERLRDSHYHSLYRTLRSARLNYSAHSAQFKQDDNSYKLVMDVREWVGGELTVRTAGGTVSVRGKVDANSRTGFGSGSDSSTSTRTLHRRFTLAADADCDKVHSTLSKDAVLTINIPKRTDVRVIPVEIEGSEDSMNKQRNTNSKTHLQLPTTPEPSISNKDMETDKSTATNKDKKDIRKLRRSNASHDLPDSHQPRRKTKNEEEIKEVQNVDETSHGKRKKNKQPKDQKNREPKIEIQTQNSKEDKENKVNNGDNNQRPRQRESKYEEIHEINIPITIESGNTPDKIYHPVIVEKPKTYDIKITTFEDEPDVKNKSQESKHEQPSAEKKAPRRIRIRKIENTAKDKMELGESSKSEKQKESKPKESRQINITKEPHNEKDLPSTDNNPKKTKNHNISSKKPKEVKVHIEKQKERKKSESDTAKILSPEVNKTEARPANMKNNDAANAKVKTDTTTSAPSTPKTPLPPQPPTPTSSEPANKKFMGGDVHQDEPITVKRRQNSGSKRHKDSHKRKSLESPKLKTPLHSPGSREIKVEKRSSLQEDDMFKDCWKDFSSTLQDVLSRLQELSAELGQSKLLVSDQLDNEKSEDSPQTTNEDSSQTTDESCIAPRLTSSYCDGQNVSVGGVKACSGQQKSYQSPAQTNIDLKEHGPVPVYIKKTPYKLIEFNVEPDNGYNTDDKKLDNSEINGKTVKSGVKVTEQNEIRLSRPTSLYIPQESSLLQSLRKNSPVEALQKEYLKNTTPIDNCSPANVHIVAVELQTDERYKNSISQEPVREGLHKSDLANNKSHFDKVITSEKLSPYKDRDILNKSNKDSFKVNDYKEYDIDPHINTRYIDNSDIDIANNKDLSLHKPVTANVFTNVPTAGYFSSETPLNTSVRVADSLIGNGVQCAASNVPLYSHTQSEPCGGASLYSPTISVSNTSVQNIQHLSNSQQNYTKPDPIYSKDLSENYTAKVNTSAYVNKVADNSDLINANNNKELKNDKDESSKSHSYGLNLSGSEHNRENINKIKSNEISPTDELIDHANRIIEQTRLLTSSGLNLDESVINKDNNYPKNYVPKPCSSTDFNQDNNIEGTDKQSLSLLLTDDTTLKNLNTAHLSYESDPPKIGIYPNQPNTSEININKHGDAKFSDNTDNISEIKVDKYGSAKPNYHFSEIKSGLQGDVKPSYHFSEINTDISEIKPNTDSISDTQTVLEPTQKIITPRAKCLSQQQVSSVPVSISPVLYSTELGSNTSLNTLKSSLNSISPQNKTSPTSLPNRYKFDSSNVPVNYIQEITDENDIKTSGVDKENKLYIRENLRNKNHGDNVLNQEIKDNILSRPLSQVLSPTLSPQARSPRPLSAIFGQSETREKDLYSPTKSAKSDLNLSDNISSNKNISDIGKTNINDIKPKNKNNDCLSCSPSPTHERHNNECKSVPLTPKVNDASNLIEIRNYIVTSPRPQDNSSPQTVNSDTSIVIEPLEEANSDSDVIAEEVLPSGIFSPKITESDIIHDDMGVNDVIGSERRGVQDSWQLSGNLFSKSTNHNSRPRSHVNSRTTRSRSSAAEVPFTACDDLKLPSHADMGGFLSRGRTDGNSYLSNNGANINKGSNPSVRIRERKSSEESDIPSYVKQKSEPAKRYSGFAHVNSDNVRRMRDIWGTKPDQSNTTNKIPPSGRRIDPSSPQRSPIPTHRRSTVSPVSKAETVPSYRREPSPLRSYPNSPTKPKEFFPSRRQYPSPSRTSFSTSPSRDSPTKRYSSPSSLATKKPEYSPTSSTSSGISSRNGHTKRQAPSVPDGTKSPPKNHTSRRSSDTSSRRNSWVDQLRTSDKKEPKKESKKSSKSSKEPRRDKCDSPRVSPKKSSAPSPLTTQRLKDHQRLFTQLRDANLQPDSEAICFVEEPERYKMVLDVEEYVPGEIELLQEDKRLVVKGEVKSTDVAGNTSIRTFHRTFAIPANSREEDIDSALSREGILTIFVPKKKERVIKIELVD